jgi:hypothetical protein
VTFAYIASFDVTDVGNGFGTVSFATAGKTTAVVTLSTLTDATTLLTGTTSVFNHAQATGVGGVIGEAEEAGFSQGNGYGAAPFNLIFQQALRLDASNKSWGTQGNLNITFSNTTLVYTLSYSATMTVTFSNANTARLFGFTALSLSGAASYVSTITPYFVIRPVLLGVCDPSPNYEPEGIAVQATSNTGQFFGLARASAPLYRDWIQQYEPPEKAERPRALAAHPFTHQALFENCRTGLPFIVIDGGFGTTIGGVTYNEAFALRAEGSMWKPERASPGNGAQLHVSYKALVLGILPL